MNKLKQFREKAKISQYDFAKECGLSVSTIRKYEQGYIDLNSASRIALLKMCNVLNCKISDITESTTLIRAARKYENRIKGGK